MDSPDINAIDPSRIELLIKLHKIRLAARYGRNSLTGVPKINPNTRPMAKICIDIPRVIQKGPRADLL
jgi:hypothetical protein